MLLVYLFILITFADTHVLYSQGQLISSWPSNNFNYNHVSNEAYQQQQQQQVANEYHDGINNDMNIMHDDDDAARIDKKLTDNERYAMFYFDDASKQRNENDNVIQQPPMRNMDDEMLMPSNNFHSHYYGDDDAPLNYHHDYQPQVVFMEPQLLANELRRCLSEIERSPLLSRLLSVSTVPIPPPLIVLTNFGDGSYRYIRNFDDVIQPSWPQRRFSIPFNKQNNDDDFSRSFNQNSERFDDFMQRAFPPFPSFPSFNNNFPPNNYQRPIFPHFEPPSFTPIYPNTFPEPQFIPNSFPEPRPFPSFNIHKPQMPDFPSMNMKGENGYPTLIQIGNRNTNTKSENSKQTGIIQMSLEDENYDDNDGDINTSTMANIDEDTTPFTEDYETSTIEDRIDPNLLKTLAG